MKLVINYDFFDAILNVNEEFTPMKIVRNNKGIIGFWYLPVLTILNYVSSRKLLIVLVELIMEFGFLIGSILFYNLLTGIDDYKNKSKNDLLILVSKLKDLYIKTDNNLLLKSELISKKYKINLNKESLIEIMESKYILVPTYDFNGNVKNTSILQEHIIGSNNYVLSIGSPKKELKFAYSSI